MGVSGDPCDPIAESLRERAGAFIFMAGGVLEKLRELASSFKMM